jgi:hypothetical protein
VLNTLKVRFIGLVPDVNCLAVFPLAKIDVLTPSTSTHDSHYCTCLGHLGWHDSQGNCNSKGSFTLAKFLCDILTCFGLLGWCNTDRIISTTVVLPKVTKASTSVSSCCNYHCCRHCCANLHHYKYSLSAVYFTS